ncbi:MAG: aldehyde dehydrogenase family protein [Pseudomonadota bacterium]
MNIQTAAIAAVSDGVFIDNAWRPALSGETLDVIAPGDGLPFTAIASGGAEDIDAAVAAARRAVDGAWGAMTAYDRGRLMDRWASAIEAEADALTAIESRDAGKPLSQARNDVTALIRYLRFYSGAADKLHGEAIPTLDGVLAVAERVPFGVTGHIIPWNYPVQMFGRSVGGALAAGNAAVLKPAEDACLSLLRLAELAAEAGFPPGALNVVPGLGATAGAALAAHPGVDFISFTGSPETGARVQQAAAAHHAGCTLELGGKSPQVIFSDADLDAAIPVVLNAIVQNGGQTCSAGARALVEASALPEVQARLVEGFSKLRAGPPEADLNLGPLINAKQKQRVERFCAQAAADGIPLLAEGGVAPEAPESGHYVAPRLYGPVPRDHALAREEVFGPVLSLIPFEDEADAVRLANGTDYGLVAGVWTTDAARALRVARKIRAGQVFVNAYGAGGGIELPFGGMGKSGHGREKGFEGLKEFTTLRTLVIKHG